MLGVGCHKRRALVDRSYMWVIKPGGGKTNRCEGRGGGGGADEKVEWRG